jgi:hypothetical protein
VELDIAELLTHSTTASSEQGVALTVGYPLMKCLIPNSEVYFSCEVKLLGEVRVVVTVKLSLLDV